MEEAVIIGKEDAEPGDESLVEDSDIDSDDEAQPLEQEAMKTPSSLPSKTARSLKASTTTNPTMVKKKRLVKRLVKRRPSLSSSSASKKVAASGLKTRIKVTAKKNNNNNNNTTVGSTSSKVVRKVKISKRSSVRIRFDR